MHCRADLQSVHGFCCCDNIHVCNLIALYTANAYSTECKMSASACTRFMAGFITDHFSGPGTAVGPVWCVCRAVTLN